VGLLTSLKLSRGWVCSISTPPLQIEAGCLPPPMTWRGITPRDGMVPITGRPKGTLVGGFIFILRSPEAERRFESDTVGQTGCRSAGKACTV